MLYLNRLSLVFQEGITEIGISPCSLCNLPEDCAGRHRESEINAQQFCHLRNNQPIRFCLMHRLDRFTDALHKTVVVGERAIYLSERGRRENDVSKGGRFSFEKLLYDEQA